MQKRERESKIEMYFERKKRTRSTEEEMINVKRNKVTADVDVTPPICLTSKERRVDPQQEVSSSDVEKKDPKAHRRYHRRPRRNIDEKTKKISKFFLKLPAKPSTPNGRRGPMGGRGQLTTQLTHQTKNWTTDLSWLNQHQITSNYRQQHLRSVQ